MRQLTERSEIIVCKKRNRIVTTFTQCNLETVIENTCFHRQEVVSYLLNFNKYDKITLRECDNIFTLITDELTVMYDKFFSPNLMSMALCSEFILNEDPYITYLLYNARNLIDKEYIQYI